MCSSDLWSDPAMLLDEFSVDAVYRSKPLGKPPAVFRGTFVMRRPRLGDNLQLSVRISRLTQGAPWDSIPQGNQSVIVATAACGLFIIEKPDWFKLDGSDDGVVGDDLILELYSKYQDYLTRYFRGVAGARPESKEVITVELRETPVKGVPNPG